MENFAERLYCDLKNASIKIEKPHFEAGGSKVGQFPNSQQLNIIGYNGKFKSNRGPAPNIEDKATLTFTEAYSELISNIKDLGNNIKFYNLTIPWKGVLEVQQFEFETVIARYIKDYYPEEDSTYERWDVIVQKV